MNKKFTINLLSKEFYKKYSNEEYKEILLKQNRPYLVLLIKICNIEYAIPFRSHIKHKYGFKLDGYKNKKDYAGLDFTKSIVIKNQKFIAKKAFINKRQFMKLNSEFSLMVKQYKSFLKMYFEILNKKKLNKTEEKIFKMSTLRFFI